MARIPVSPTTSTQYRWSSKNLADRFSVEDPATGEVIGIVQGGGAAEVGGAVQAANEAFHRDWRWRPSQERSRMLFQCADVLDRHADELATLVSKENGKPIADARQHDVNTLTGVFRFFASLSDKLPSEFYDRGSTYTSAVLEPLGVVGAIIPFNWPPIHTANKIGPALAVGNTLVMKPSEQAPFTTMRIIELLNTVLPADVLHGVPGLGSTTGQALVAHPLVKKVTFTGSTKAGVAIAKAAAENITPVTLELGGKNAFIVFDEADVDRAVRDALEGAFYNKGEACTAASRLLVQRGVHDMFVERLAQAVRALKVGSGADPTTHVGPLVSKPQQQKVLSYIELGHQEGARIAAQAPLSSDPKLKNGFFVPPTLFVGVERQMRIAREEIFGPVATIIAFESEDEAVSIANEPEYGLVCAIYTRDSEQAFRTARRIDVGMVMVNNYVRGVVGAPFGGTKHSGYGRENAIETLREFGFMKTIRFPSGIGTVPSWRAIPDIFGAQGLLGSAPETKEVGGGGTATTTAKRLWAAG